MDETSKRLTVKVSEYDRLRAFLESVGVRSRVVVAFSDEIKGERHYTIEAENPYRFWIGAREKECADKQMTPDEVAKYQM